MSYFFDEEEIEIAKLTLNSRTSGTETWYFSTDYYPANSVWGTGKAAWFVAANSEFLSVADSATLSFGDEDFSIAGWVYFDSVGSAKPLVTKYNTSNHEYWVYMNSSKFITFAVSSNGTTETEVTDTSVECAINTWYYFVAWHDATANTINVTVQDAEFGAAASAAHTTGCFNGTSAFCLGKWAGLTEYHNGRLDSIGIWRRKLTAGERTTIYNAGEGMRYEDIVNASLTTSLCAWWDLDEESGVRRDEGYPITSVGMHLADNATVSYAQGVGGNPAIWPLLRESPRVRRSIGPFAGNRHTLSIRLLGHVPIDDGKTLCERWNTDFYLHGGTLEIQYRVKPAHRPGIATPTNSAHIRQTLEIVDASYSDNDGIIQIDARDVWFKTKELSIPLETADFDDLNSSFDNQPGAIYFGTGATTGTDMGAIGAIGPAPCTKTEIDGTSDEPIARYFCGWTFDDHENRSASATYPVFYARNRFTHIDKRPWLRCELPTTYTSIRHGYGGSGFASPGAGHALADKSYAIVFSPSIRAELVHAIGTIGSTLGTAGSVTGNIIWQIFEAGYDTENDIYFPVGSPLWQLQRDYDYTNFAITTDPFIVQVNPPVITVPSKNYMVVLSWSNPSDATNTPEVHTKSAAGTYYTQARNSGQGEASWVKVASTQCAIAVYVLGRNGSYFPGSGTARSAAYHTIAGKALTVFNDPADEVSEFADNVEFRVGVQGIKDDGSGTYTGSAGSLIDNPADLIAFTLIDDDFGCAVDAALVDADAWEDTRDALVDMDGGTGLVLTNLTITLDRKMDAEAFILEICRHARLLFYKSRAGLLTIAFPRPLSAKTAVATVTQSLLHDELVVLSYEDTSIDEVVNTVEVFYQPDILDLVDDPELTRRGAGNYVSRYTATDAASETLHGRREYRQNLDWWVDSDSATELATYILDRFADKHQQIRIALPRRDYHNVMDVTDKVTLTHTTLKNGTVDGEFVVDGDAYDAGDVPQNELDTATFTGQVIDVQEVGPTMIVTLQSDSDFNDG